MAAITLSGVSRSGHRTALATPNNDPSPNFDRHHNNFGLATSRNAKTREQATSQRVNLLAHGSNREAIDETRPRRYVRRRRKANRFEPQSLLEVHSFGFIQSAVLSSCDAGSTGISQTGGGFISGNAILNTRQRYSDKPRIWLRVGSCT